MIPPSCALLLIGGQVFAQDPAQGLASAEGVTLPRVIDAACIELVEALNGCETALLLGSDTEPDTADLVIISDRRGTGPQQFVAVARAIVFDEPMFGQSPSLERAENGSLHLLSEQVGVGRSPWSQALTIAQHDGQLLVTGWSHSTYDRILGGAFGCDLDLLTGDWTTTAERPDPESGLTIYEAQDHGRIASQRILVADWT